MDIGSSWSNISSLRKDRADIPPLFSDNHLVTDNALKAEALNTQFQSVFFTKEHSGPLKTSCPDQVSARVLKETAESAAPILKTIFTYSMDTGDAPDDWRKVNNIRKVIGVNPAIIDLYL